MHDMAMESPSKIGAVARVAPSHAQTQSPTRWINAPTPGQLGSALLQSPQDG